LVSLQTRSRQNLLGHLTTFDPAIASSVGVGSGVIGCFDFAHAGVWRAMSKRGREALRDFDSYAVAWLFLSPKCHARRQSSARTPKLRSSRRSPPRTRAFGAEYVFDLLAGIFDVSAALIDSAFAFEPTVPGGSTDRRFGYSADLLNFVSSLVRTRHGILLRCASGIPVGHVR
jgi:hypothetical protein